MKRFLLAALLSVALASTLHAQSQDAPASRADIERYLQIMKSHDMMNRTMKAMIQPMHDMIHQQFEKNQDKLPPDFESRMDNMMDQMLLEFPYDKMMDAMIPVYQKHFTKGDVDSLVAFYSTPTGQKLVRELPEITAESMTAAMPLMQKHMEKVTREFQDQLAAELKKTNTNTNSNTKN